MEHLCCTRNKSIVSFGKNVFYNNNCFLSKTNVLSPTQTSISIEIQFNTNHAIGSRHGKPNTSKKQNLEHTTEAEPPEYAQD